MPTLPLASIRITSLLAVEKPRIPVAGIKSPVFLLFASEGFSKESPGTAALPTAARITPAAVMSPVESMVVVAVPPKYAGPYAEKSVVEALPVDVKFTNEAVPVMVGPAENTRAPLLLPVSSERFDAIAAEVVRAETTPVELVCRIPEGAPATVRFVVEAVVKYPVPDAVSAVVEAKLNVDCPLLVSLNIVVEAESEMRNEVVLADVSAPQTVSF